VSRLAWSGIASVTSDSGYIRAPSTLTPVTGKAR
jgi:hypothetical protein